MTATFDELLAKHLEGLDSYVAAVEAERFRDYLVSHYPEVLATWRAQTEVAWIADRIRRHDASKRSRARRRASARQFHEATEQAHRGEPAGLEAFTVDTFSVPYVVDGENTRKRAGDMTGPDHRFVADQYELSANRALMLRAFHLAVAKKAGNKRTRDVMTVEQYEMLYRSITGEAA